MNASRYHNTYVDGAVLFWTSSIVQYVPVFRSPTAVRTILSIWDEYRLRYSIKFLGYVIMPEHIHFSVWSEKSERAELFVEQTLRRSSAQITTMTANAADRGNALAAHWLDIFRESATGKSNARVWKERGRAFPVESYGTFRQKLNYMHENPVRRQLVTRPEDWMYSSASWYAGGTSEIGIDTFDW